MAPMSRRPQVDDARRLSVQQTASRVLLEQASLDEAMAEILRALATELDWSLAVYWVVASGAPAAQPRLQCRAIWAAEPIRPDSRGRGLAGGGLEAGRGSRRERRRRA